MNVTFSILVVAEFSRFRTHVISGLFLKEANANAILGHHRY